MAKKIETKVVKRTKVEKEMTLLRAIERVVEVSKDSKLKAEAKADMSATSASLAIRATSTLWHDVVCYVIAMQRTRIASTSLSLSSKP